MSKIRLTILIAALTLLTGVTSYAADSEGTSPEGASPSSKAPASQERSSKLTLTCSDVSEQNYSLVIDLDQKMVDFGMVGAHKIPITSVGDSQFLFNDGLGEPLLYREGEIDRITGKVHLFISQAHFPPNDYYLQCKPAKPLF